MRPCPLSPTRDVNYCTNVSKIPDPKNPEDSTTKARPSSRRLQWSTSSTCTESLRMFFWPCRLCYAPVCASAFSRPKLGNERWATIRRSRSLKFLPDDSYSSSIFFRFRRYHLELARRARPSTAMRRDVEGRFAFGHVVMCECGRG